MALDNSLPSQEGGDSARGFAFALSAYLLWGFLPIYMKAVAHISPIEVIVHRVIWSVPIAAAVLIALGRTTEIRSALKSPKMLAMASLTAALISINWGIYIWAIGAGRALDAALGYFINPLFSIFLGAVLLKEKLYPAQIAPIGLVAIAIPIPDCHAACPTLRTVPLTPILRFYAFFRSSLSLYQTQRLLLSALLLSSIPPLSRY